jgi:hypothetical protein
LVVNAGLIVAALRSGAAEQLTARLA